MNQPIRKASIAPWVALLAVSFLLPMLLFALAAWQNRGEAEKVAESRVEKTVGVVLEHAIKVYETHRLVIDQVNERLRTVDWTNEADLRSLHELLKRIQLDLDQIATITVTNAEGAMLASSRVYPATPAVTFEDRDWFRALKERPYDRLFVSRSYVGRQSGQMVFNVADRVESPDGTFRGAIAISVDRAYFDRFYASIEPEIDCIVIMIREDGEILARAPTTKLTRLPPVSRLMEAIKFQDNGQFNVPSSIDGVERIFSYRKVAPYPVLVGFGLNKQAALAGWRRNLVTYGIVAALSALALLIASFFAIRQTRKERAASEAERRAAAAAATANAERAAAESQVRQLQKMEAVGRLTGGVAHDFNNLLTVVIGNLDMLRRRLKNDDRNAKLVSNALEGANRAATLTQRLLAFSRQQPLEPKRVDVNKLVSGISELLHQTLGETVSVETVLAGGLWPAFADANQLENAILNLAVNARDAMPDNNGKLTIETGNIHLDDAYAAAHPDVKAGQYVMIAVCDDGTGMPPDVASKAFEPFFTTKEAGKGTGLGLSQVYGFAKQSNGHVAIYSEKGQGTTVKIYLPRAPQSGEHRPAEPVNGVVATEPARGELILVLEDDEMVRRFAVNALYDAGYQVKEAANGAGALALLRSHPEFSMLFTDIVLGGEMNGRVAADQALALFPNLKILFTTGYTPNAIIHHGRLDEGVNFIGKPFTAMALAAKVRQVLDA